MEVYAIADEKLMWRHFYHSGWSPWRSMSMPDSSAARDVTALGDQHEGETELYLATETRLYRRKRVTSATDADFGAWRAFADQSFRAIAVGNSRYDVHWVVGVDDNGELFGATGKSGPMSTFGSIDGGAVDIAAGYESGETLFFVAVDAEGGLWRRAVPDTPGQWTLVKAASSPPKLTAISVASSIGNPPILFAVDDNGDVHRSANGTVWTVLD